MSNPIDKAIQEKAKEYAEKIYPIDDSYTELGTNLQYQKRAAFYNAIRWAETNLHSELREENARLRKLLEENKKSFKQELHGNRKRMRKQKEVIEKLQKAIRKIQGCYELGDTDGDSWTKIQSIATEALNTNNL